MKFVDEFRDQQVAARLAKSIERESAGRDWKIMEVCGGHTHTIYKYGIEDVLPGNVELVHGPGCPVCVIPMGRVDDGIAGRVRLVFPGDAIAAPPQIPAMLSLEEPADFPPQNRPDQVAQGWLALIVGAAALHRAGLFDEAALREMIGRAGGRVLGLS